MTPRANEMYYRLWKKIVFCFGFAAYYGLDSWTLKQATLLIKVYNSTFEIWL